MVRTKTPLRSNSDYPPEQSFGYLVRESSRLCIKNLQDRISLRGVLLGQWYFLRVLWESDGMTQRELSDLVGMKESTTFSALTSMERSGLISRERSTGDKRKIFVYLTVKGRRLRRPLLRHAKEVNDLATQELSQKEKNVLLKLLSRVHRTLQEHS